ncbi:MAG: FAD-binding protein [Candidatus Marinimicrobia bacterium]|nr:FAD-binding protein [Candidatus Neomarinimicrobiota bacterium]
MALPPRLLKQLRRIVGRDHVDTGRADLQVFESDGLTLHAARPACVVYPVSTQQCSEIARACTAGGVPFVARGAGTGLSGGALSDGGVIVQLSRMNRLLAIHPEDRYAVVQPGVVNNYLSLQTRPLGLEFAPDPSSQMACTIGGNLAENAGGPHTLKYGVTSNHILGQTVVFSDGEVASFGGPFPVSSGPDFSTFLVGTEGTIAIATEIIVRLVPVAPSVTTMLAVYSSVGNATDSVSAILEAGVLPAALELIDQLCIQAVETRLKAGFPTDAAAVLLSMDRLASRPLGLNRLAELGALLGSDVPFAVRGGTVLVEGRGERLLPLRWAAPPRWWCLLVCPPSPVSTEWAYEELARRRGHRVLSDPSPYSTFISSARGGCLDAHKLWSVLENDFQPLVEGIKPIVARASQLLADTAPLARSMSGSGSTVYGIYDDRTAARRAETILRAARYPVFLCTPVPEPIE